ncbi:hypothetical protein OGM63_29385 [Plectonema radiosum NIES-515]|uniref:Uncharacterized protein n=1 Tax=Plectonema radiosum NIES-515 TaxID=2986073 RepID=A0ABT3B9C6_9CYAN|nr:hypothetical protein [Plectonema radiosum]MCV3217575.1 hypothetical protein [Plectonema radiosum NIES-515]
MNELFKTSDFSSKNDATRDFQLENLSSKKILGKGTDLAWDEPTKVSSKKIWKIGDRCEVISPKKYSGEKGHVCGFHADDISEFWVKLDNYDLQIRVTVSPQSSELLTTTSQDSPQLKTLLPLLPR